MTLATNKLSLGPFMPGGLGAMPVTVKGVLQLGFPM